jgi:hypothetical protein
MIMKRMLWLILALSSHAVASGTSPPQADATNGGADKQVELVDAGTADVDCEMLARTYRDTATYAPAVAFAPADRGFSGIRPEDQRIQADITINEDGSAAVVSYARKRNGIDSDCKGHDVRYSSGWELTFKFPVNDQEAGFAEVLTLDGLSSGYSIEFTKNWSRTPLDYLRKLATSQQFRTLCEKAGLEVARCTKAKIMAAIATAKDDENSKRVLELQDALRSFRVANYSTIREYAVNAKVGHKTFDYLTPQLGEKSEDRLGWSVGASASFIMPSREHLFAVGIDYGRSYRPGREVILCPASNGTDPVECVSGPLGPPIERNSKVLWTEARGGMSSIGYSLRIAHDFESDTTGVDLPIYLLRNAKGALTGGIRLGWSNKQDTVLGVFLSSPLEL